MLYAVMTVISAVGLLTGAVSACMAYRKGLGAICGISFLDAGTSFALGLPAMSYFFSKTASAGFAKASILVIIMLCLPSIPLSLLTAYQTFPECQKSKMIVALFCICFVLEITLGIICLKQFYLSIAPTRKGIGACLGLLPNTVSKACSSLMWS